MTRGLIVPHLGCSTFLKVIGNQRSGFVDITGDVRYGGIDSKTMEKKFRSEVLYNPEDGKFVAVAG